MPNLSRKAIGDANQKARQAAMNTLTSLRGKNVADLKTRELANLIALLMQWLGLVDEHGNIK